VFGSGPGFLKVVSTNGSIYSMGQTYGKMSGLLATLSMNDNASGKVNFGAILRRPFSCDLKINFLFTATCWQLVRKTSPNLMERKNLGAWDIPKSVHWKV